MNTYLQFFLMITHAALVATLVGMAVHSPTPIQIGAASFNLLIFWAGVQYDSA